MSRLFNVNDRQDVKWTPKWMTHVTTSLLFSESVNAIYYTNAVFLLVETKCVVIVAARSQRKYIFSDSTWTSKWLTHVTTSLLSLEFVNEIYYTHASSLLVWQKCVVISAAKSKRKQTSSDETWTSKLLIHVTTSLLFSKSVDEIYYKNAWLLLVGPKCVVTFAARSERNRWDLNFEVADPRDHVARVRRAGRAVGVQRLYHSGCGC